MTCHAGKSPTEPDALDRLVAYWESERRRIEARFGPDELAANAAIRAMLATFDEATAERILRNVRDWFDDERIKRMDASAKDAQAALAARLKDGAP